MPSNKHYSIGKTICQAQLYTVKYKMTFISYNYLGVMIMIYGLSDRIKTSRIQKGLTQVQVSKRLNVTKSAVNSWETNASTPSIINIIKLSQMLNVSTDYLLGVNGREGLTIDIVKFNDLQKEAILSLVSTFNKMNDKDFK